MMKPDLPGPKPYFLDLDRDKKVDGLPIEVKEHQSRGRDRYWLVGGAVKGNI